MAISKIPKRYHKDIKKIDKDRAAQNFIEQPLEKIKISRQNKIPVMLRFDVDLLTQIDKKAKKRGVSRSSWIHFILSEIIEQEEKE